MNLAFLLLAIFVFSLSVNGSLITERTMVHTGTIVCDYDLDPHVVFCDFKTFGKNCTVLDRQTDIILIKRGHEVCEWHTQQMLMSNPPQPLIKNCINMFSITFEDIIEPKGLLFFPGSYPLNFYDNGCSCNKI